MRTKIAKRQLGTRLSITKIPALKELAEGRGYTLSGYVERIIELHLVRVEKGGGQLDLEEALDDLELRIVKHLAELERRLMERPKSEPNFGTDLAPKPAPSSTGPNGEVWDAAFGGWRIPKER